MAKVLDITSEEYKLGQRIQKFRKAKGMTQNQLADLMNLDRANISNYENGTKGEMGFKTLIKFSRALEVPVSILLGEESDGLSENCSRLNLENRVIAQAVIEGLLLKQGSSA